MVLLGHMAIATEFDPMAEYDIVEMYAGARRVCRLGSNVGLKTVALDKSYCERDNKTATNSMDVNTSAGFLLLVECLGCKCIYSFLSIGDFLRWQLRLHCTALMRAKFGEALGILEYFRSS